MKTILAWLIGALLSILPIKYSTAQANKILQERPGTFNILSRTDYVPAQWGFTTAEVNANMEQIKNLVAAMRQNEVLKNIKGFNGRARIHQLHTNPKFLYGVPARISFEFSSFFYNKKGDVVFNIIEPPSWSVFINYMDGTGIATGGFDAQKVYFTIPLKKQKLAPGIDLYGDDCYVLYDPLRPPYWLPVTIDEAFASKREFNDAKQDEITALYMRKFLDDDYNAIPVADRKKPAYSGGNISGISASPDFGGQTGAPIMKPNPAYWNKSLPKSAIQIMTLHSNPDKNYLRKELADCYKYIDRGSGCDLLRFEVSFGMEDIQRLAGLIKK